MPTYYIDTTQAGIIKGLNQESLSIYVYNNKAINKIINGYLSSNPEHPTKNKQYNIGLAVHEHIPAAWIRSTSYIIHEPDTDKTDTKQENFKVFFR